MKEIVIANRSLALEYGSDEMPKRIHIVPRGELKNAEAGVVQILDDKAIDSILTDLVENKARNGGLYMGEEHFVYDPTKSSQAFAWATKFEKDDKGIWALSPDYTDVGAPAIKNKRFKWTSFAADPKFGHVESLGGNKFRVLKIDTVGFTNYANGKELLTPIGNRFPGASSSASAEEEKNNQRNKMKSVAAQLKLSADASEESIVAEVLKLQNRITTLEPLEAANTTLKNRNTELETEQCDQLLDLYQVTDPKARGTLKPMLSTLKNRDDRVTALTNLGHKLPDPKKTTKSAILNRGETKGGEEKGESNQYTEADQANAGRIKNRADELHATNPTRNYTACWKQAEQEVAASK